MFKKTSYWAIAIKNGKVIPLKCVGKQTPFFMCISIMKINKTNLEDIVLFGKISKYEYEILKRCHNAG